jgi:hypothetical protein
MTLFELPEMLKPPGCLTMGPRIAYVRVVFRDAPGLGNWTMGQNRCRGQLCLIRRQRLFGN